MPEKSFFFFAVVFWTLLRKSWIASFQALNPTKVSPKFPLALAISIWPKEMKWVYTLGTAGWILTFVVLNWQVWMCWSLLILGSRLLAERYGIRFRNESAGAKKTPYCLIWKNVIFSGNFSRRPKKRHFFGVRKIGAFSDSQPDVGDHPESAV